MASMRSNLLVFSAVRVKFEKKDDTNTPAHADLFYAAIVYSIQIAHHGRMLHDP